MKKTTILKIIIGTVIMLAPMSTFAWLTDSGTDWKSTSATGLDVSHWTTATGKLPYVQNSSHVAVIGNYVYLFGGHNNYNMTNTIWRAPISDPTNWSDTGAVLPTLLQNSQVAVIGNYVYLFGGQYNGDHWNVIYRAPVSDPTHWVDTGAHLPSALAGSQVAVIGDKVYLFGGQVTNEGYFMPNIYTAPVSDPTSWTDAGARLPKGTAYSQLVITGGYVYLFGGYNSNSIWRAPISNPLAWTDTGKTIPSTLEGSQVAMSGDFIYLFGGARSSFGNATNAIYQAPVSDPTSWTTVGSALPDALYDSQLAIIGNRLYLFGGVNNSIGYSNLIYYASLGVCGEPSVVTTQTTCATFDRVGGDGCNPYNYVGGGLSAQQCAAKCEAAHAGCCGRHVNGDCYTGNTPSSFGSCSGCSKAICTSTYSTSTPPACPVPQTPQPAALSCNISFDKNPIDAGESTNIHWTATNADAFYINSIGWVGANGQTQVAPAQTTDYSAKVYQCPTGTTLNADHTLCTSNTALREDSRHPAPLAFLDITVNSIGNAIRMIGNLVMGRPLTQNMSQLAGVPAAIDPPTQPTSTQGNTVSANNSVYAYGTFTVTDSTAIINEPRCDPSQQYCLAHAPGCNPATDRWCQEGYTNATAICTSAGYNFVSFSSVFTGGAYSGWNGSQFVGEDQSCTSSCYRISQVICSVPPAPQPVQPPPSAPSVAPTIVQCTGTQTLTVTPSDHHCVGGQTWDGTQCSCSVGQTWDGSQCVLDCATSFKCQDIHTKVNTCSGATVSCGAEEQCVNGSCVSTKCVPTFSCQDTQTIVNSCTGATSKCIAPQACSAGVCILPAPGAGAFGSHNGHLEVHPSVVARGTPTTLFWNITNVRANTCSVKGTNGDVWNAMTFSGADGVPTSGIMQATTFTLSCTGTDGSNYTESRTANILPAFHEQ